MQRRDFFKYLCLPVLACGCSRPIEHLLKSGLDNPQDLANLEDIGPAQSTQSRVLKSHAQKNINFDADYEDDIYCDHHKAMILKNVINKFRGVEKYVGNGNFNLTSMDDFFLYASRAPGISALNAEEKKFIDEIFFFEATKYGFGGEKVFHKMTDRISKNDVIKIPRSGHFLKRGESVELYNKLVSDLGNTVILTSGVRAMAKQFHLFLEKAALSNNNLSRASRSIAPPGYSFHGHNDFDIGKIGFGLNNFTDEFSKTSEFKRLTDLGYVDIRYKEENNLGVRFEPWHIKV